MPADPTPLSTGWEANLSPEILDSTVVEIVDSENSPGSYVRLAPGTPHPNQELYPGLIFLTQKTLSHDKVQRYWTTPAYSNEDLRNWETEYVHESPDHPIYVRRYKTRRDQYQALPVTTTLTGVWNIKITNPGSGYDPDQPPTVTIAGTGSGATATALVNPDGTLSWIRITAEGTGYAPLTTTVTIAAPSAGVTATATATVQSTSCYLLKQQTNNFPEDDPRFALFLIETRLFHTLPGPVLTTWEFQERIDKYVKIEKQLILKSAVPADPNDATLDDGVTIEYQDLTARHSAKITTTIPADIAWENDGPDFVYEGTVNVRFPDQITEDPVIIVAFAIANSGSASFDYGWDLKVEEGYSGPCRAVITERYTFDPTAQDFKDSLPSPTQVFPKAETIWISTAGIFNNSPQANVINFVIPLTLHRLLTVTSNVPNSGSPTSGTAWKETVEATVPTKFETGDSMLQVSEPQRVGIGKLWLVRFIEIFHP